MIIIIAMGAFKQSLTSTQATHAVKRGLQRSGIKARYHCVPIADGGNGTLDAFMTKAGWSRVSVEVLDPIGRPITAEYGISTDEDTGYTTAVIEMALASGLELLAADELDVMRATTYGTGQLMQHALNSGANHIIVGMGGSATVDGGAGALQALGVRLLTSDGHDIPAGGGGLSQLATIDTSGLDPRWADCQVTIASDVENPTLGDEGAAAIFAPQKGANPQQVEQLEANLRHFFTLTETVTGVDVRGLQGGGAAGAFSAGLAAYVGGQIESGIALVLKQLNFNQILRHAALVITGEGRMDEQTIYGKGPFYLAKVAQRRGVPVVGLVGGLAVDDAILHRAGLTAVLPVVNQPMSLEDALTNAEQLVEQSALRLGYLLQIKTGNGR